MVAQGSVRLRRYADGIPANVTHGHAALHHAVAALRARRLALPNRAIIDANFRYFNVWGEMR
jgi:hypothetical protein